MIAGACGSSARQATPTTVPTATSTTAEPTTSVVSTSTTVAAGVSTAVFPDSGSSTRYADPVAAARAFATDYVGFTNPVLGEFRQGDARSGEVEVRPRSNGPVTTVLVRQVTSDASWWVLGAATDNIRLQTPAALAEVSSPVSLAGTSTAFEGTVQTEIRQNGGTAALGKGYVTGGANGVLGPFSGTLSFAAPSASGGAVLLYTVSAENGQVWEAAVLKVNFAR